MSRLARAAKLFLRRIDYFSQQVIGIRLYDYQAAALEQVVESVVHREGREFLLVFPRQSGKNEAVAHLLVYLLNIFQRAGGQIVYAAIGDGLGRGLRRLEERLENRWNAGRWQKESRPLRRVLGRAAVVFLSSHPSAYSRGETADWLLVVDEMQDQDLAHLEAVFEPMRAAHNASALYIGTVRFTHDALWRKKQALERLQAADGRRRVFVVRPEQVAAENPQYGDFLARKVQRLGRQHPIVRSEYFLEPVDGGGGLFPRRRRQLMAGRHPRGEQPAPERLYVATLDVGGQDEASTDPVAQLANPARDYTVATIFEVDLDGADKQLPLPTYRAVDVFVDHGSRHFQDAPGRPALVRRLVAFLEHWSVAHLVGDATGVGEGVVDWLAAALGRERVTAFRFSPASKARLGSRFLSLVETGRFKYWRDAAGEPGGRPLGDGWWFWQQCRHCAYEAPPGGVFERDLRWGVPATARLATPAGRLPVHDDRLVSAALVAVYDELWAAGALGGPGGPAAVVPPQDPLDGVGF